MNISLIAIILSLLVIVAAYLDPSVRHTMKDGDLYEAAHIRLPGYVYSYAPEHTIHLKDWVGSNFVGLTVEVDGVRNAEVEAEPAIRAIGWATSDYVRELGSDGHWILRKSEQTFRSFSLFAWYRISPWKLSEK